MPTKIRNSKYKSEGRCPSCGIKHNDSTIWCEECLDKRRVDDSDLFCVDCGAQVYRKRPGVRPPKRCKECQRERNNAYQRQYNKSPERRKYCRERMRELRAENYREFQDRSIKHRYGVSLEYCERIFEAQDGRCAICDQPIPRLDSAKDRKFVCIDHDHKSNKVRGILCSKCNSGLGFFGDDQVLLPKIIDYLFN